MSHPSLRNLVVPMTLGMFLLAFTTNKEFVHPFNLSLKQHHVWWPREGAFCSWDSTCIFYLFLNPLIFRKNIWINKNYSTDWIFILRRGRSGWSERMNHWLSVHQAYSKWFSVLLDPDWMTDSLECTWNSSRESNNTTHFRLHHIQYSNTYTVHV